MKGDFTRFTFDRTKHYSGIRMQQGRVQLDSDWNELGDIQAYRMRTESEDFIGPSGAPKLAAGFAVRTTPDGRDLAISPGRMYVDGILCENEEEIALTAQPDLPGLTLPQEDGLYLAYLEVWHRHVTALEDPSLREVGLGGPDTATRVKAVWQVKLHRVGDVGMPADATTDFPAWTSEVAPSTGALRARPQPGAPSELRNRLYRVEIHRVDPVTGKVELKWSRDNGSTAGRWLDQSGAELTVESLGGTRALDLSPGDWIELADDTCELRARPGTLVRVIGVVADRLTLDPATATGPIELARFPLSAKVRRWDSHGLIDVDPDAAAWVGLEDGIEVRFLPGMLRPGDYWLIPARGTAGGIEWPRDGEGEPEAVLPHGIGRHYSRMALVEFEAGTLTLREDCRFVFSPLTDLKEMKVLQAATNAPDGAIYVDAAGNVGVGTTDPTTTLEISGSLRLRDGGAVSEISSDETLAGNSNERIPTERAVKEYVDNLLVGSIAAFAMEEPPTGWLECNGQALRRTEYEKLFIRIGTSFGSGDGATTFNVPDLRGEFIRGWDHGRQVDVDPQRQFGSAQDFQLQDHRHNSHGHSLRIHTGIRLPWEIVPQAWGLTAADGKYGYDPQFVLGSGGTSVDTRYYKAGSETRARNVALMFCIKH